MSHNSHPSEQRSDLHYTSAASPPELTTRRKPSLSRRRRQQQVEQLERQYRSAPAYHHPTVPPAAPPRHENANHESFQLSKRDVSADIYTKTSGLTREEEVLYAFRIQTFRAAMKVRDELVKNNDNVYEFHERSPTEANWAEACGVSVENLRKLLEEGQGAREAVVAANIGLVTSIAKRHYAALKSSTAESGGVGTILTIQDMVQEGTLGLMEAVERYKPEKGFRFSTYATWWVKQRILRSILDSSRTIRLPAHVHAMLQKMKKAKMEFKEQTGREPTTPELAHHLDVPLKKIQLYAESSRNVLSLEKPLKTTSFKEDSRTLGDTLASEGPTPEEDIEADYLRRDIRAVMETSLAASEREVIINRYGLEDGNPRSVAETADSLGLTVDRVRLVEARALNKLRHPQRSYKLKEYINKDEAAPLAPRTRPNRSPPKSREPQDQNRIWFF
ncbi:hypothetical protein FisN_17Lh062 [Fistulifera solaris]|uniref:RNA polymerase sigma-70 domain-containing protein n=1 Tax=Fistulifera solaris TaxID=1519565 RepID=A0A1Z5K1T4_FISSO|nr:hypothetical protein FisN_17Lh062 [Fistulifera solaris]|eukprot:GAX20109.1 hypothetical protein FisN_17Lh062 [Fistulifera solaris]